MTDLATSTALWLLVAAAVGWPAARGIGRSRSWGLALTPISAGVACSATVAASIVTKTSMVPWLAVIAAAGWALRIRTARSGSPRRESDAPGLAVLGVAALVAILPVLLVDVPATESDARSSWWFHAALFRHGGAVAHEGLGVSAFRFSRPGYPPLVPGFIAAVWHLGGAYDREIALRVSQLLVAAGVCATAFFVSGTLRLSRRGSMCAAALIGAACWGANAGVGLSGFVDLTWALAFVPAAILLLAGDTDRRTIGVAALFAAAAALMKVEAQAAAMILVFFAGIRAGREWRRVVPVAGAVVAAIAGWFVATTVAHAPTEDRGSISRLMDLFRTDSEVHHRFTDVLHSVIHESGALVGLAVFGVLLAVALGRLAGSPLRQPGLIGLLLLALAYVGFVAVSLAISTEPLEGYFDSGLYRYVLPVRLLALMDVLLAWIAAARALGLLAPRPEGTSPAPVDAPVAAAGSS